MEWLIIALVVIALIACYAGAICEMKREIRKFRMLRDKAKKEVSEAHAHASDLEDVLARADWREAERRASYRALLTERDNLVRQLQIKTAIIEKLDEKTAARK